MRGEPRGGRRRPRRRRGGSRGDVPRAAAAVARLRAPPPAKPTRPSARWRARWSKPSVRRTTRDRRLFRGEEERRTYDRRTANVPPTHRRRRSRGCSGSRRARRCGGRCWRRRRTTASPTARAAARGSRSSCARRASAGARSVGVRGRFLRCAGASRRTPRRSRNEGTRGSGRSSWTSFWGIIKRETVGRRARRRRRTGRRGESGRGFWGRGKKMDGDLRVLRRTSGEILARTGDAPRARARGGGGDPGGERVRRFGFVRGPGGGPARVPRGDPGVRPRPDVARRGGGARSGGGVRRRRSNDLRTDLRTERSGPARDFRSGPARDHTLPPPRRGRSRGARVGVGASPLADGARGPPGADADGPRRRADAVRDGHAAAPPRADGVPPPAPRRRAHVRRRGALRRAGARPRRRHPRGAPRGPPAVPARARRGPGTASRRSRRSPTRCSVDLRSATRRSSSAAWR